eukprot:11934194-Heterocapsa_arctica.AAC.1
MAVHTQASADLIGKHAENKSWIRPRISPPLITRQTNIRTPQRSIPPRLSHRALGEVNRRRAAYSNVNL